MKHNVTVLDNVLIESAYQVKNTSQQLLKKFRTNSEFKDRVYCVFENILTASRIKALTYNSLFGSVWRAICSDRGDHRRQEMLDKLSSVISSMNSGIACCEGLNATACLFFTNGKELIFKRAC